MAMKERISELKRNMLENQEARVQAEKKDAEMNARIENAVKTCSELVVFHPLDLASLRAQYTILTMIHGWKPLEISGGNQVWLFDDIIEVHFSNQGDSYLLSTRVHEATGLKKEQRSSSRELVEKISLLRVCFHLSLTHTHIQMNSLLKMFDKNHGMVQGLDDMKAVLRDVSTLWESCKSLVKDMQKAGHFTSSQIQWVDDESSCSVKTTFFNAEKRSHVKATFSYSITGGMLLYPFGQWSFDVTPTYGTVDMYDFRLLISRNHIQGMSELETGSDLLTRCCKLVQEILLV